MHHTKGFTLLELVAVLALSAGLLLSITQIQSLLGKKQNLHQVVYGIESLQSDLIRFQREHERVPQSLIEVWGQNVPAIATVNSIQLQVEEDIELKLLFNTEWQALQVEQRLMNTRVQDNALWVRVPKLHRSELEVDSEQFLHRFAVTNQPELNQMHTDLDMHGNSLLNVRDISATSGSFSHLQSETLRLDHLLSETLTVTESATIAELSADHVLARTAQVDTLSLEVLESELFSGTEAVIDTITAESIQSEALVVEMANFRTMTTKELKVGQLYATDVIAGGISFNELHQRLQVLEVQWLDCKNSGGCR